MKTKLLLSLLAAGAAGWLPPPARAADAPPAAPARPPLSARIDLLLRPHLKPVPLPVSLPNPFLMMRGSAEFTDSSGPAPALTPAPAEDRAPASDGEILARSISQLKIGGTMHVNDVTQLMINRNPYKEGDYVTLEASPAPIHVQIVRLTRDELTLRYNEVTQTVRLKVSARP